MATPEALQNRKNQTTIGERIAGYFLKISLVKIFGLIFIFPLEQNRMSTIWRGRHNWCTFRQEVRLQSVTVFDNQLAGKEGLLQTRQVHHRLFPHWSGGPEELASYWPRGIQRLQIRPPGGDRDDNLRLQVPLPLLLL